MALQKRYKIALETKLDQLWHQGFCVLERWELAAWFNKDRITNVVWREILENWQDIYDLKVDERPLNVIKCDSTSTPQTFVIIQLKRAKKMKDMAA
ncbi:MAG: hypothetical protein JKY53_12890 [Flavobacteriales bacterium]|nr:hypothetical protein [Flavobacteriales bacterium]